LANAQRRIAQIDAALAKLTELEAAGVKPPKRLPITDLDSRVLPNKEGGFAPNYTPTAMVDVDSGMIAECDVLNDVAEEHQLLPALGAVRQDFGAKPKAVLGARLGPCAGGMALGGHGVQSLSLNDAPGRSPRACRPRAADRHLFHVTFPSRQPDHALSRTLSAPAGSLPGGPGGISTANRATELN
jgi:hypothetical protein